MIDTDVDVTFFKEVPSSPFFSRFLSTIMTLKSQLSTVFVSNFIFHTSFHPLYWTLKYESPQEPKECKGPRTPRSECLLTQTFCLFLLVEMKATLMNKKLGAVIKYDYLHFKYKYMFFLISIRQIAKLLIYTPGLREKVKRQRRCFILSGPFENS